MTRISFPCEPIRMPHQALRGMPAHRWMLDAADAASS
jgi:hypothetical protein